MGDSSTVRETIITISVGLRRHGQRCRHFRSVIGKLRIPSDNPPSPRSRPIADGFNISSSTQVYRRKEQRIMVEPRWSIKCTNSTLDLLDPSDDSYTDLKTQHRRRCWKYFCWCRRHTISVICINESRKLYWFNCRNVQEKVTYGSGEGYYHKLLRLINGALNTWAQRYIDGLSVTSRDIMLKINGSADNNMKLLKEGCYCHYHPHMTADACNADFLRRVVSFWAGESLRGIRERLRGMTNITKKVEDTNRESSLFSWRNVSLDIFRLIYYILFP